MQAYPIIDADAHVVEAVPAIRKYLQAEYQSRPIWTSHSWDMDFGGTLGKQNDKPEVQLADMDAEGISAQVIFPSRGLSLNFEKQTRLAVDVARAYNDWLAEFCSVNPRRLKGVALVALQDIDAAIKEVDQAVRAPITKTYYRDPSAWLIASIDCVEEAARRDVRVILRS